MKKIKIFYFLHSFSVRLTGKSLLIICLAEFLNPFRIWNCHRHAYSYILVSLSPSKVFPITISGSDLHFDLPPSSNRPAEHLHSHNEHDVPTLKTRAAFSWLWSFGKGQFSDSPSCCSWILILDPVAAAVAACHSYRRRTYPPAPSTVLPAEPQSAVRCCPLLPVIAAKRENSVAARGCDPTVHHKIIFSYLCLSHVCKTTMDIFWFHTSVSAHSFVRIVRMPAIVGQKLF